LHYGVQNNYTNEVTNLLRRGKTNPLRQGEGATLRTLTKYTYLHAINAIYFEQFENIDKK